MAWAKTSIRRLLLVLSVTGGCLSLSTCGVDKLLKPPPGGTLQITPTWLEDSAAAGSIAARVTSIQISNGATGVLGWTAAVSRASSWLHLGTLSGNAPGTLAMSADPSGLGVGVYHDTIVVSAMSGGGEAHIPIQFTVHPCAIQPLVIGDNAAAVAVSDRLAERGLLVPAIRPPTVPQGSARLRISLSAVHSEADVARLVESLNALARQ